VRPADRFNASGLSRWLNSPPGRVFRLVAGIAFLAIGAVLHAEAAGVAALIWSFFPLSAGACDVCYVSAALGGPFSGRRIRQSQLVAAHA
jgi:hypothetical protein